MKILGAIIIVCSCWILGVDFYKSNISKLEFAKGLYDGAEYLKSEIVYSCDLLGESLLKSAAFSGCAAEFIELTGKELVKKGVSTEDAFKKTKTILAKSTNKDIYLLTKDLFLQLGEKDCDNQGKLLDGYLERLAAFIKKQSDFCEKECVVFKKTGLIAGIGIVVLLI